MAVIKQTRARKVMHHADVFDLGDIKQHAHHILDHAQQEAAAIVEAARQEAERLTSGAAEAGYARGLEQGLSEGRQRGEREGFDATIEELKPRLDATLTAWESALQHWENDRTCMFLEARRDVLELALKLARRVVHRQIEIDPSIITDQLAAALSLVGKMSSLVISINPDDRAVLGKSLGPLLEKLGRAEHVALRDDENLGRGGCIVRTEGGRVDASIDVQLDRITASLLPGAATPTSDLEQPGANSEADA